MRIGVDLDGIVVDFPGSLRKELIKTIGYDFYSKPAPVSFYINEWPEIKAIPGGSEEVVRISQDQSAYKKAKPIHDAIKSLNTLRELGHELWFITARPKNLTQTTIDWFEQYDLAWAIPNLIVCDALFSDRAKAKSIACNAHEIEILIDDQAETIKNIVCPSLKLKLLIAYPWNVGEQIGPKAYFCKDWQEILDRIGL